MKNHKNPYSPIFELTCGGTVESVHFGAIAVVDVHGILLFSYGDPDAVTFLRSTAKPFQALPFFEQGGPGFFNLSVPEQAILCASHSGTDEHVATVQSIQEKVGVSEAELLCGVHKPFHEPTAERMHALNEPISANRHNCSGKHTGMLAYARLKIARGEPVPLDLEYIDPTHPIQKEILKTFAQMCDLPTERVELGIDGCSAPNFAVPLRNAALAYARLCDPEAGCVLPPAHARACREITAAMTDRPDMVGGPGQFDTVLMQVTGGRVVSKTGAEAFQGIGLMPDTLASGSQAVGIAMKIADGDDRKKVRTAVAVEVLRQLEVLKPSDLEMLVDFGPEFVVENWRNLQVGHSYPTFKLDSYRNLN